jgi:hypothetical protein
VSPLILTDAALSLGMPRKGPGLGSSITMSGLAFHSDEIARGRDRNSFVLKRREEPEPPRERLRLRLGSSRFAIVEALTVLSALQNG